MLATSSALHHLLTLDGLDGVASFDRIVKIHFSPRECTDHPFTELRFDAELRISSITEMLRDPRSPLVCWATHIFHYACPSAVLYLTSRSTVVSGVHSMCSILVILAVFYGYYGYQRFGHSLVLASVVACLTEPRSLCRLRNRGKKIRFLVNSSLL